MLCHNCQTSNDDDARFCKSCGYRTVPFEKANKKSEIKSTNRLGNPRWATISPEDFVNLKKQLVEEGKAPNPNHPFYDKNFALSLFLESMNEPTFWVCIALVGGNMKTGVSKQVDYLVEGEDKTGKYEKGKTTKGIKARELIAGGETRISIIEEDRFLELLGDGVLEEARQHAG